VGAGADAKFKPVQDSSVCRALSLSALYSVRCLDGITFQIE